MRRRGVTILETTVGLVVLSSLAVVTFALFAWCTTVFRYSSTRIELQGEIRRINNAMRKDILGTAYTSLIKCERDYIVPDRPPDLQPTVNVTRSAVCFAAITDISDPNSYNPDIGLCHFDCWTIYNPYTNPLDVTDCKLYRYRILKTPGDTPYTQLPLVEFPDINQSGKWLKMPKPDDFIAGTMHCYSDRIRSFDIDQNLSDQTLEVKIALQGRAGRSGMGRNTTSEVVESSILLKAENTWPRL